MSILLTPAEAWLENADHERIPIQGSCSIGRSSANQVVLPSDKISRRHALIQMQAEGEYWLVDFGSRNGTYLNGQRIGHPTRLRPGDRLATGPFEFLFMTSQGIGAQGSQTRMVDATVAEIRTSNCWLLVTEIMSSEDSLKNLNVEELPAVTGRWVAECKQIIEEQGGRINQFMGDGFFACWRDQEGVALRLAKGLQNLTRLQEQRQPAFRMVAHYGAVALGGLSIGEEQRISGREVHFTFRMGKLAEVLGEIRLLSEPAKERLSAVIQPRELGHHTLAGFEAAAPMYAF